MASHPGYQAPATYDIYYCSSCDSSMAHPLEVDDRIYDLIYSNPERVPGYDRYQNYAKAAQDSSRPLDFLAESEDVYWAIREYLLQRNQSKNSYRILEVGCGLGYLTHSIARQGYQIEGLDISERAVAQAKARFGNQYINADLIEFSKTNLSAYEVVILTEVIEHVPQPFAILEAIHQVLEPGGEIVLTTPNRSVYPSTFGWHTDPPPVHLWWFSESSIRYMAHRMGYGVRFIDFSAFNNSRPTSRSELHPTKPQTFDADGNIIFKDRPLITGVRAVISKFPALARMAQRTFKNLLLLKQAKRNCAEKSLSLCAILSKP
jgi:SAM-dependent methyltransferase